MFSGGIESDYGMKRVNPNEKTSVNKWGEMKTTI